MKTLIKISIVFALLSSVFTACTEEDLGFRTKEFDLAGEYLSKHPNDYSIFYQMLQKTNMLGLLDSYGEYTIFAPNNEALSAYFSTCEFGSLESFPLDSLKKIVRYQIIDDDTLNTELFKGDRLRSTNMEGDYFQTKSENSRWVINGKTIILLPNQFVKNGVVHMTNGLIFPDAYNVPNKIDAPEFEGRYSIFSEALKETGVANLLLGTISGNDYSYADLLNGGIYTQIKRYRYTMLVESDGVFQAAGINSFADLKARYSPNADDIQNPENGLYRFMAYHCLDRLYDYSQFMFFAKSNGYEITETLCPNSLLEFRNFVTGVVFNPVTNADGTVVESGTPITTDESRRNIIANNGMIHEISAILEMPETSYFNKRIRFDICSLLPELLNNGFRGAKGEEWPDAMLRKAQYFDNLKIIGEAGFVIPFYYWSDEWMVHQGDELLIGADYKKLKQEPSATMQLSTRLDVTLTLPPIPAGILWELRFGFTSNESRGMFQLYFDGVPTGMPLWQGQVSQEDYGVNGMDEETARRVLYNNDFMPYPTVCTAHNGQDVPKYSSVDRLRRIIGRYSFSTTETHTLRFKSVKGGQLSLDFFEIIPVDQIDEEGKD
jgi:uncharacterized surface protein with fasciclin (FAS1) repeats